MSSNWISFAIILFLSIFTHVQHEIVYNFHDIVLSSKIQLTIYFFLNSRLILTKLIKYLKPSYIKYGYMVNHCTYSKRNKLL